METQSMTANEIRKSFIDFFKDKEHTFVPSSPVIPSDDPTLLFTNAGMNQFKDIFLNKGSRSYTRAVNSQKCIRVSGKHNDLEEVGHDTYHHTFFEMLGNWSFGDYYKKEAIRWAWELLTINWKLPKDKLYATVFRDDNEAAQLWQEVTDIAPEHIMRFDEKDNFWEMGDTGPCGPCSEIHIDLGPGRCDHQELEHNCAVNGECGRYIELWNLVFIQFNRDEKGKLHSLPAKHVDTGAGFERFVAVLQNKRSNYATDIFTPLLDKISQVVGIDYAGSQEQSAYHVLADHIRMLTFSIADGGFPSNEGRGYVMRRILRRAARYGRKLNMHEPFIYELVDTVVNSLGSTFPEIKERAAHVKNVIRAEEEHFNRTLDRGLEIFAKIKQNLSAEKKIVIPGIEVFRLYDTYGFPADLTRILAEESGLKIDSEGFEREMQAQQERARKAAKFGNGQIAPDQWIVLLDDQPTDFVGYAEDAIETHLVKYAIHKDKLHIVLKETPFYAESGGQIGDHGRIIIDDFELRVLDTRKDGEHIIHICDLPSGFSIKSDRALAEIETGDRRQTEKNHTATHLLHAALRKILGEHVQQAGSLVEPERLRFDFTHHEKVSKEQIRKIEELVNEKIQEGVILEIAQDSFENAKKRGAMALFGEKYSDVVRTVQVDEFSLELCGGTHVQNTGEIGLFIITSESSIASGIRRIEAITGITAIRYFQNIRDDMQKISELLNARENEILAKTIDLIEKKRYSEKELEKLTSKIVSKGLDAILAKTEKINDINVLIHDAGQDNVDQLKELGDRIREKAKKTVALLGTKSRGKVNFVCVVTDDLIKTKNLNAGELVRQVARIADGSGGGRSHMATAGGKNDNKFAEAMQKIKQLVAQ